MRQRFIYFSRDCVFNIALWMTENLYWFWFKIPKHFSWLGTPGKADIGHYSPLPDNRESASNRWRYPSRWDFTSSCQSGWTFGNFQPLCATFDPSKTFNPSTEARPQFPQFQTHFPVCFPGLTLFLLNPTSTWLTWSLLLSLYTPGNPQTPSDR